MKIWKLPNDNHCLVVSIHLRLLCDAQCLDPDMLALRFLSTADHRCNHNISGLLIRKSSLWMFFTFMTSLDPTTAPSWCMINLWKPSNMLLNLRATSWRAVKGYHEPSSVTCLCCCHTLSSVAHKITWTYLGLSQKGCQQTQRPVTIVYLYPANENISNQVSEVLWLSKLLSLICL